MPINPPPQQIQHTHRPGVGQSGKEPPRIAQIQGIYIGEKFNGRAEKYQYIEQDTAQGKPVGVERAALRVQKNAQRGPSRRNIRTLLQAVPVAGLFGQQVINAAGPQIERAFIRVKAVAVIPIQPVQAQNQGRRQKQRQQQRRPGKAGKAFYGQWVHRSIPGRG